MKKRILAIICIMFLLFTATTPLAGGVFSYADEPQQEQLSQDEVIKAAIALYLNERKAWITSTTSAPIDAVQNQMQIWIDSYEFWTNNTTIGSAAAFYAQCIVRYNPFRISLKGPAVRALNDLYNWLIDSGKLPNLDADDQGGETTDNLYNGKMSADSLYYSATIRQSFPTNYPYGYTFNKSAVTTGTAVRGITGDTIINNFLTNSNMTLADFNNQDKEYSGSQYPNNYNLSIQYNADVTLNIPFNRFWNRFSDIVISPSLKNPNRSVSNVNYSSYSNGYVTSNLPEMAYLQRTRVVRGNPAYILLSYNGVNRLYYGFASTDYTDNIVCLTVYQQLSSSQENNAQNVNVNFDTDNFNKTDPTPPEGDDEVTYIPSDKTTGNTYNTYNEYITNYVTKNTVVNNNNSGGGGSDPDEPETPGGTTPPWNNSSGSGTITPDGNGGYNFNLPDLTLPDLDIDWSINGLKDKFPFSIPWDLMAFFTVLNAEPETPSIQADIDLGIVDWEIDWDFHNFDTLAALLRNLEFIGFCLALLLITRSIIKG